MDDHTTPDGYTQAQFSAGFLDHGGPYFLCPRDDGLPGLVALRVMAHHINYQDAAHGGVLSTFADVALSHAIYDAERPRMLPSTSTLTTNFLSAAKLGDWLVAEVTIDRIGSRTGYTSGAITCGDKVIATMSGVFSIRRAS
ncbi:MAG: PaaI family thioesterase [Erythrobacter sp.]